MFLANRDPVYNFFNEMFRTPFMSGTSDNAGTSRLMKTDIQETETGYCLDIDLPGFSKENIQAELKDGYLTVTATKTKESDEESKNKYLRRERFQGTCKRSFYVGEYLQEEDIHAEFKDGVLKLSFNKEPEPIPEQPKLITIE